MKKIAVFTTTRAEFGIFSALIREAINNPEVNFLIFVGGSHLTNESGKTISEIQQYGFCITKRFDYLLNEDSSFSLTNSLAIETFLLAEIFQQYSFDYVCILGDRFELLPIVTTSILFKIPIIHIHGGEQTTGLIDEQIRHMITKASHLHFTTSKKHSQNIVLWEYYVY